MIITSYNISNLYILSGHCIPNKSIQVSSISLVSVGNLTILPSKEQSEKALSLALIKFSDVIDGAYKDNAPHKICQYIYEVSNSFNGFYHNTKILANDNNFI
jgi:arginyl-tRNA synthetase